MERNKFQQVSFYLKKAANLPQRTEGEAILFDLIPKDVKTVIDLGTGDGHLLKLLKRQIPHIKAIALVSTSSKSVLLLPLLVLLLT